MTRSRKRAKEPGRPAPRPGLGGGGVPVGHQERGPGGGVSGEGGQSPLAVAPPGRREWGVRIARRLRQWRQHRGRMAIPPAVIRPALVRLHWRAG